MVNACSLDSQADRFTSPADDRGGCEPSVAAGSVVAAAAAGPFVQLLVAAAVLSSPFGVEVIAWLTRWSTSLGWTLRISSRRIRSLRWQSATISLRVEPSVLK